MVVSLRYPPMRVLAALLCVAIVAMAGIMAASELNLGPLSSERAGELLLASRSDKVTYWAGFAVVVTFTVALGALAVAAAPATVVVAVAGVAITAKTATVVATAGVVAGMAAMAWGGRPQ